MSQVFPKVEIIACTPNPDKVIAHGARVCYDSVEKTSPKSDEALITMLLEKGHL